MSKRKKGTVVEPQSEPQEAPSDTNGNLPEGAPERNGDGKPEVKKGPAFKVGPIPTGKGESVSGCVWENVVESDGRTYNVHNIVLTVEYFDQKEDRWKASSGIRPSQLATVKYVLRKCGDFAFSRRDPQSECPF